MTYGIYLKEHMVWTGIFSWLLFSLETFLLTVARSSWLMLYTAVGLVLCFFIGTYTEYRKSKTYLLGLQAQVEELDKKYLIPEMMQKGKRREERLLYEIFGSVGKSMNEQVAKYKRTAAEYKEYIEMWIHEVKVPIAAARMILVNRREENSGLAEELNRIEGYVEQALFYARSSEVEKDYLIKQVNLRKTVEEVLLQKKKELLAKKASIQMDDLDCMVYSDGKWLAFMLGQIVDNSIKYAGKEGVFLGFSIEEKENTVMLQIQDRGIGVKKEEQSRVFEKGFTGTNGRSYRRSTGIGLYLCQKLCDRLGHSIAFTSVEGNGSRVTFCFPKSCYLDEVR